MKKKFILIAMVAFLVTAGAGSAGAVGIGGYFAWQKVFAQTRYFDKGDLRSDYDWVGGGFVFDTAVATDRLFNYRLNIGFHKVSYSLNGVPTGLDGTGWILDNTFGFGLYRSKKFRFWIGPQLGLGGVWSENKTGSIKQLDFFISIGAAAGLNFNLFKNFTLSATLAYRGIFAIGAEDNNVSGDDTYWLTGNGINITLCGIIRFGGDQFSPQ